MIWGTRPQLAGSLRFGVRQWWAWPAGTVNPRLFADDQGVWWERTRGSPFGIAWDEIHCVSGHKLDGATEVYTCVALDTAYGEYVELYPDWPGFGQVVAATTERLPGISAGRFERVETLGIHDPPTDVWHRT